MKNKTIKVIMTSLQVFILIPPVLLQYLSRRKMGVARYLTFKKSMFPKVIFTPEVMYTYMTILFLGIIISGILLVFYFMKKLNSAVVKTIICTIIISFTAVFCVSSRAFEQLLAYHFFLIAIFAIVILQYIKVILNFIKVKN